MDTTKRVIALGFFDGVHLGHGALLSLCKQRADELGAVPAAFTFDVHPSSLILRAPVPLLTTPAERSDLMRRYYGIRDIIVAHYDERMMKTPWRSFVTEFLVREHGAVGLVAGHDFHFGYKGEGSPERLKALCADLGLSCDIVPKVEREDITVSSTYIRTLVAQGEMARAVKFLGHPYTLTGTVRHGKRLGSALGFPTVNLRFPAGALIPAHGVYATRVVLESGESCPAVTNVGVRPTVDDGEAVNVEGFLLDFDGDLYGQQIRVEFYDYLRPEQKFGDLGELRAEVARNAQQVRAWAQAHPELRAEP